MPFSGFDVSHIWICSSIPQLLILKAAVRFLNLRWMLLLIQGFLFGIGASSLYWDKVLQTESNVVRYIISIFTQTRG